MLKVDTQGFAELQAGRPPWSFVRELVANAWDEEISTCLTCNVGLTKEGNQPAVLTVIDDGPGFANLKDAYTLFGHTIKRDKPEVRGRFNLGEKELAAVAKEMWIRTTSGGVHFTEDRQLKRTRLKTDQGTQVKALMKWTKQEVADVLSMLKLFLPPAGVAFYVNDVRMPLVPVAYEIEGTLPTVIFKDGALRPTRRKTWIYLHKHLWDVPSWLYELGIPVQPIDGPYHVNVQQKVPLSPNREHVSDAYLRDIYAYTLEATIEEINEENVSEQWVRSASEDEIVTNDTLSQIREKRYKDAVLWSSDMDANQRAIDEGVEVIHPRTLSAVERNRFQGVGMLHSSAVFGAGAGEPIKYIPNGEWTSIMKELAALACWIYRKLYDAKLQVEFARMGGNEAGFRRGYPEERFGDEGLLILDVTSVLAIKLKLLAWNLPVTVGVMLSEALPQFLALLGHEFGHREGIGHDADWRAASVKATGQIIELLMKEPDGFIKEGGE